MRKKDIKQINSPKNLKAVTIALILLFASTIPIICLPAANAHTPPWTISTYAFLVVAPNPVGVGQTLTVNFWLDKVPPTAIGGWGMDWHNITVTVTKPDGASQVLGPLNSDAVGGTWTQFVPEQVGTYTFVGHFPGQVVHLENPYPYGPTRDLDFINDTYTASTSNAVSVSVQQAQITTAYPDNPLPTGYWQNPVNSMNRNWYSIAGNWLGLGGTTFAVTGMYNSNNGNFNPYTTAPDTAHVLWTKPLAFGGQIGGESGAIDTSLYATGTAYEPKYSAPVLISGNFNYIIVSQDLHPLQDPLTAVDLSHWKEHCGHVICNPTTKGGAWCTIHIRGSIWGSCVPVSQSRRHTLQRLIVFQFDRVLRHNELVDVRCIYRSLDTKYRQREPWHTRGRSKRRNV